MSIQLTKPLVNMTRDELCEEARRVQAFLIDHASTLQEIYAHLTKTLRREPRDDVNHAYMSFATGGVRLAGVLSQGLKRASSYDRSLRKAKEDFEDRGRRDREAIERKEARRLKKQREENAKSTWDIFDFFLSDSPPLELQNTSITEDLDELFGDEY